MNDIAAETPPADEDVKASGDQGRTLWGDVVHELSRNWVFWISSALVLVILLMAFFPSLFAETAPTTAGACPLENARVKPSGAHPFGYTNAGCDMWSSVVYGTGKSVIVAILATIARRSSGSPPAPPPATSAASPTR